MDINNLDIAVKIAACVCGKDGVISQLEEEAIISNVILEYPNYSIIRFNRVIDEFFEEDQQIEDYLLQISGLNLSDFTIKLCEISASSDGLDTKENIALDKVKIFLSEGL
mgnify:CR=1 FL=1|jgi:hypothetical protein